MGLPGSLGGGLRDSRRLDGERVSTRKIYGKMGLNPQKLLKNGSQPAKNTEKWVSTRKIYRKMDLNPRQFQKNGGFGRRTRQS